MFNKKVSKSQSTSKLLNLLTKRSSLKRISVKRGVYDQWPSSQKPSLFNCSTNYIKYLSTCNSQHKDADTAKYKRKKGPSFAKQPATFSTCTTMEFFPSTQRNIQFHSKFTATPKSQESNQDNAQLKKQKFTPYMTPLQDESQIMDESDSHLKNINEEYCEGELNSKYDARPKTFNHQKKTSSQERRLVKTAKLHRQNLQAQQPNEELLNTRKLSTGRQAPSSYTKSISIKSPELINQGFIRGNDMKSPTMRSNSNSINCDYPMRLKDYETNFQAYKLISELIDQQIKWEPKRSRPKSSVLFRKYNFGTKA